MTWFHRTLLKLLPRGHRERYGADISRVFEEQRRSAGTFERIGLWMAEIAAILRIAVRSRFARRSSKPAHPSASSRSGWSSDLRHAVQHLRRAPGHVVTVVLCLGAGIVATLTVFSIINTLLFGPLSGIEDRQSLSRLFVRHELQGGSVHLNGLRQSHFDLLRDHGPAIAAVAGQTDQTFAVRVGDNVVSVTGGFVSGDYFSTLGTRASLGRLIARSDETSAAPVAVVSQRFWRTHLESAADAIGRVVTVAGRDVQIVGVTPEGFAGFNLTGLADGWVAPEFWLPLSMARDWPGIDARGPLVEVIVRHAPGVTREEVRAGLAVAVARIEAAGPYKNLSPAPRALGEGPQDSPGQTAMMIAVMLAAPLTLLAIGCANVANLQLARSLDRTRELSVRLALGASRARVVRLLALEAGMLAILAAGVGGLGTRALLASVAGMFPIAIQIDWRVAAVAGFLAVMATVAAGVAPAWLVASRLQLGGVKLSPQTGVRPHARLRQTLVAVQVALSLMLLVTGALFGRTLQRMAADLPDVARHVLVADVDLEQSGLDQAGAGRAGQQLVERMTADPRVRWAALSTAAGLFAREEWQYLRTGDDRNARQYARVQRVTPSFFPAFDRPATQGRTFTASDANLPLVVINAAMASSLEADGVPSVGRALTLKQTNWGANEQRQTIAVQVVGVVPNGIRRPDRPAEDHEVYLPLSSSLPLSFTVLLRGDDAATLGAPLRAALSDIEPRGAWMESATAWDRVRQESSPIRYLATAAGALGLVALLLAMAGLYAVVSFAVSLRTREIGVRMAIGATPADVTRLVLNQSVRLMTIGTVAGLAMTMPLTFAMRAIFIGVSPFDPLAFLPMLAALALVAFIATMVPARRAARIDPVSALRAE